MVHCHVIILLTILGWCVVRDQLDYVIILYKNFIEKMYKI